MTVHEKLQNLRTLTLTVQKISQKKTEEGYLSLKTKSTFDFRPAIVLDF